MKSIRIILFALSALLGIENAWAFNYLPSAGTYYYGYKDALGNASWALGYPPRAQCSPDPVAIACTITSTAPQSVFLATQNALPPNSHIIDGVGCCYKLYKSLKLT